MKHFLMSFSTASCNSPLVSSDNLPSTLFSNTISLYILPLMQDTKFHFYTKQRAIFSFCKLVTVLARNNFSDNLFSCYPSHIMMLRDVTLELKYLILLIL
jgi:hypothetical protein